MKADREIAEKKPEREAEKKEEAAEKVVAEQKADREVAYKKAEREAERKREAAEKGNVAADKEKKAEREAVERKREAAPVATQKASVTNETSLSRADVSPKPETVESVLQAFDPYVKEVENLTDSMCESLKCIKAWCTQI